jgi:hypothetical protein
MLWDAGRLPSGLADIDRNVGFAERAQGEPDLRR